ncbi:MAG: thiamine pyrophosphate-dependent enzyme, partial [Chloroflexota bacterium]|jgi:acetolactate synthase-1/2/3 large subunit
VVGDGGLQMTVQEMLTTVVDHIPVKIALMDNKKLGMIRQWQEIVYGGNYHSSDLPSPRWDKLAEAYGLPTFKASSPEQVDDAIRSAQAHDGSALVWFEIEQTQNVLPMMPAGKGLSDLIEDTGQSEPPSDGAAAAATDAAAETGEDQ